MTTVSTIEVVLPSIPHCWKKIPKLQVASQQHASEADTLEEIDRAITEDSNDQIPKKRQQHRQQARLA